MRALAMQHDAEGVAGGHERARVEREAAHAVQREVVQGEDRIAGKALEQAFVDRSAKPMA